MRNIIIETSADGHGKWRAKVTFPYPLSENDPRPRFNLGYLLPGIRHQARVAIVKAVAEREQTTRETFGMARARVNAALPNLKVLDQDIDSGNLWHGITLGEQ